MYHKKEMIGHFLVSDCRRSWGQSYCYWTSHLPAQERKNSALDRMFQLHFDKFTIPARSDENILEKNEKMLISNSEVFSEPMGKESSVGQIFQQQMPNISNKAPFRARL